MEAADQDQRMHQRLEGLWDQVDVNKDYVMSRAEFNELLDNEQLAEELCQVVDVKKQDLQDLYLILDMNGRDEIRREDFLNKLPRADHPVTQKSVYAIEKEMTRISRHAKQELQDIK